MKIAGVSMTYNDGFKIKEWKEHYLTYKEQIGIFVIVDNGSEEAYVKELKETFPDAVILERGENGGCTAAYNDGIRYVLEHTDAEAIAIIGNDIKPTENCLPAMYDYLFSDEKLGIISTAILNIDSDIIDNYGHIVKGQTVEYCNRGENIHQITCMQKYTDLVSGGFTMAKREFYEKAGLQDEKLFMYCDELDTMHKARKAGFKIGVMANEYAWHWHINPPATGHRSNASRYLIARNRVYISQKHEGPLVQLKVILKCLFYVPAVSCYHFLKSGDKFFLEGAKYSIMGTISGMRKNMELNQYTVF